MEQSKPSDTEASLEELIKLAQSESTDDQYERITDVGEFILDLKVTPSTTESTETLHIYWAYCKWCKSKKIRPVHREVFFTEFNKKFTIRNNRHSGRKYWVASEPFNISKDEWWVMRKALRNEKQQGKKAKKSSKKPRTKSSL